MDGLDDADDDAGSESEEEEDEDDNQSFASVDDLDGTVLHLLPLHEAH